MTTAEAMSVAAAAFGILATIFGLGGAIVAVFWRGASFTKTITDAMTGMETRLRAEMHRMGDGLRAEMHQIRDDLRAENRQAHAAIGEKLETHGKKLETLSGEVGRLREDVAYLRGRRDEGQPPARAPRS